MSREDVRASMASWEAESADYQELHRPDLNRWDLLAWGTSNIPEDQVGALRDGGWLDR
jgi:hypothetical protein